MDASLFLEWDPMGVLMPRYRRFLRPDLKTLQGRWVPVARTSGSFRVWESWDDRFDRLDVYELDDACNVWKLASMAKVARGDTAAWAGVW